MTSIYSLGLVQVPNEIIQCSDVKCNNSDHRNLIDEYVDNVLSAINDASYECLPVSNQINKKRKPTAGWNTEVKPFKDRSMFWSSVWKSAGKPLNNTLHQIMKRCRNLYHFQAKKVLKAQNEIKRSKLLSCLTSDTSNGTDIFTEVKKLRNGPRTVASVIDGQSSKIENHFASIYKKLYNSVDDQAKVSTLLMDINSSICQKDLEDVRKVTPLKVKEAAGHLNSGKSYPVFDFSSDCLKNGPDSMYDHLSNILQAIS